jgi:cell division protein DivIC
MEARSKFLDPSKIPLKQRVEGNIWATLVHITQLLLVVAMIAAVGLWFLPVIQQSQRLQKESRDNAARIAQAMESNRRLQLEVELLKSNPLYVERLARDKLNLGKPGEVIFRFDPYQNSHPNSRAAP